MSKLKLRLGKRAIEVALATIAAMWLVYGCFIGLMDDNSLKPVGIGLMVTILVGLVVFIYKKATEPIRAAIHPDRSCFELIVPAVIVGWSLPQLFGGLPIPNNIFFAATVGLGICFVYNLADEFASRREDPIGAWCAIIFLVACGILGYIGYTSNFVTQIDAVAAVASFAAFWITQASPASIVTSTPPPEPYPG